jgi:hypothetical protein
MAHYVIAFYQIMTFRRCFIIWYNEKSYFTLQLIQKRLSVENSKPWTLNYERAMHHVNRRFRFVISYCMTIGVKVFVKMPRAYSQHLRRRAIWLTEILGFQIDEVHISLQMSTKTISWYVRLKFRLVIMEILLQHPKKTLSEILHEVYEETGSAVNATNSQCQRIPSLVWNWMYR